MSQNLLAILEKFFQVRQFPSEVLCDTRRFGDVLGIMMELLARLPGKQFDCVCMWTARSCQQ